MASRARNILQGAREALAIAKGEAEPAAFKAHVPPEVDVRAIRVGMRLTQAAFAQAFGLSIRTLQQWEIGRQKPDVASRTYLKVIQLKPDAVKEALAA